MLIHQLVGYAMERITLSQLDPNGDYSFLNGQTPTQRIDQLQVERSRVKEITRGLPVDPPDPNDLQWISYFDRIKIYGERAALEWFQKRKTDLKTR